MTDAYCNLSNPSLVLADSRYMQYLTFVFERIVDSKATNHLHRIAMNNPETTVQNSDFTTALHSADRRPCGTPALMSNVCAKEATKNG